MPEDIEGARELGIAERSAGDWRIVASAWLVAILFVVLFTAGAALAFRACCKLARMSSKP